MKPNTYDIGDQVEIEATFTDPKTKALVEPASVICTVLDGKNETLTPEVTNTKGIYSVSVGINAAGYWHYAFDGSGGYKASAERSFKVREQKVPR
jgi:hypothetical protein